MWQGCIVLVLAMMSAVAVQGYFMPRFHRFPLRFFHYGPARSSSFVHPMIAMKKLMDARSSSGQRLLSVLANRGLGTAQLPTLPKHEASAKRESIPKSLREAQGGPTSLLSMSGNGVNGKKEHTNASGAGMTSAIPMVYNHPVPVFKHKNGKSFTLISHNSSKPNAPILMVHNHTSGKHPPITISGKGLKTVINHIYISGRGAQALLNPVALGVNNTKSINVPGHSEVAASGHRVVHNQEVKHVYKPVTLNNEGTGIHFNRHTKIIRKSGPVHGALGGSGNGGSAEPRSGSSPGSMGPSGESTEGKHVYKIPYNMNNQHQHGNTHGPALKGQGSASVPGMTDQGLSSAGRVDPGHVSGIDSVIPKSRAGSSVYY